MLNLINISKNFKSGRPGRKITILDSVNLFIEKGKIISVKGVSGAGKTTLLNVVSGLIRPSRGSVYWKGRKLIYLFDIMPSRIRNSSIGYIFQTMRLIPEETAISNILLPLRIKGWIGKREKDYIESILKGLDIWDIRRMKTSLLSGGQKQKVAIARALANRPELILADEPTANLDKDNALEVCRILKGLSASGIAVLAVTHQEDIENISDSVYLLEKGKLGVMK